MLRRTLARARQGAPSTTTTCTFLTTTSSEPVFFNKVTLTSSTGVAYDRIPAFRVLDGVGKPIVTEGTWATALAEIPEEKLLAIYKTMLLLPVLVSPPSTTR
jgi:hypothetical protein